jgi:hypothetical protein
VNLSEIVARAKKLGIRPEDLDETVHDCMDNQSIDAGHSSDSEKFETESHRASDINNAGLEEQLRFIFFGDEKDGDSSPENVEQVLQNLK